MSCSGYSNVLTANYKMANETRHPILNFTSHSANGFSHQSSLQYSVAAAPLARTEQQTGYPSLASNFGPTSQAWTVPLPSDQNPSEPPPSYSAVDNSQTAIYQAPATNYNNQSSQNRQEYSRSHVAIPVKFRKEYLRSNYALLKLMEFVVCLIGFSAYASFREDAQFTIVSRDRSSFFVFVLVSCWLFTIMVFWLNLIGYMERYHTKANALMMLLCHALLAFFLLLCSSLITGINQHSLCIYIASECTSFRIAVAAGFIAMVLFCADTGIQYYHYKQY